MILLMLIIFIPVFFALIIFGKLSGLVNESWVEITSFIWFPALSIWSIVLLIGLISSIKNIMGYIRISIDKPKIISLIHASLDVIGTKERLSFLCGVTVRDVEQWMIGKNLPSLDRAKYIASESIRVMENGGKL